MYNENKVEIDRKTAGLLCSAIISDTLLFRSPTCTPMDQAAALNLAQIAGIDAEEFAKEKEEYYLLHANAENPLPQDWSIQTEEVQNGYEKAKRAAPAMREMIQAAKEAG